MSASRCYLDYNATAPLREAALRACVAALESTGNASSVHREGRDARGIVEGARRAVAALVGADADRVIFTSGGTEGANLVLTPDLRGPRSTSGCQRLLVAATDHPAVLRGHRFAADRVTVLSVRADGLIDMDALALALAVDPHRPALVAVQAANNESGVIQPVADVAAVVHAAGGLLVCDAVQAVGRLPFDIGTTGADAVILSGHKLGGPQGIGAVVLARGVSIAASLIQGGGQERGYRAGTENVPGIAGFGAAADAVRCADEFARLIELRDGLESALLRLRDDLVIFGAAAPRLPNTTCFAVPGLASETLLMALDLEGFAVSSGSACSSGKVSRSHVLAAMGVDPCLSSGAIRVSTGERTRASDLERFVQVFGRVMQRMQRRSLATAA